MANDAAPSDTDLTTLITQLTSDTDNSTETELIQQCDEIHNFNSGILNYLDNYKSKSNDIYKWLFVWIKSSKINLVNFAIQFLPSLIWNYLYSLYATPSQTNSQLKKLSEICLLQLIPQLANEEQMPIPNFTTVTSSPSIYHRTKKDLPLQQFSAPSGSAPKSSNGIYSPLSIYTHLSFAYSIQGQVKKINSSNRSFIILASLNKFKQALSSYPRELKLSYCHMCTRMCYSGFSGLPISKLLQTHLNSLGDSSTTHCQLINSTELEELSSISRIQLDEKLLIEMCNGLRFCLEKSLFLSVLQAAELIYQRSNYYIYQSALITSNALLNILLDENCNGELALPRNKMERHNTLVQEDLTDMQ